MRLSVNLLSTRLFVASLFAAGALLSSSPVMAAELVESWSSARAMGMGNAFTAVARDGESLFYNPAALARVTGIHWTILDPRIGVNGPQAIEVAGIAANDSELADKLSDLYGKSIWLGGGAKTSFVIPYFGAAAYANGDVGLNLQNPAYPQANINYIFDYGITVGAALDIVPQIWSIGLSARRVNRTGTNLPMGPSILASLDTDAIMNQLKNRGTGYGLDVGTMLTLPLPIRPTLGFTIRNFGYTAFSHDEGMAAPPRSEPDMTLGAAFTIDLPLFSITPAVDYRYMDRPDIQVGKKLHLGIEFDLPLLSLRAGFNQGYYTGGVGLDFVFMSLEAATYGVELGEYPGQLEDRRYMVQMKFDLGLDGDLFSLGSSSGSSGSRGRLKQRR